MLACATDQCAMVDGARIRAADVVPFAPAFAALSPDRDLGPAPSGTMVRVFYKAQLAALLPGVDAVLPDRLCVQRKRDVIPMEAWQAAVDESIARLCPGVPWKAKVLEAPKHRFPSGAIQLHRAGLVASRGSEQIWRGALVLPDKSTIPVWVRAEVATQRRAAILQRPLAAGSVVTPEDYREEEIWAPGLCQDAKTLPRPDGLLVRRAVPSGEELLPANLRRPPAVHRGQSVELEAASGPARLRVPAVAAHDAEVGETVHLQSSWNGTKLVGRVTGAQKAKVE